MDQLKRIGVASRKVSPVLILYDRNHGFETKVKILLTICYEKLRKCERQMIGI